MDAYWRWVVGHHYRPQLKSTFVSWLEQSRHVDYSLEVKYYPLIPVAMVRAATHFYWDYAYLWLSILFFILLGLHVDHFLDDYYVIDATIVSFPLVLMIVTQIIPAIGAVVAVVYYNDLAKFLSNAQINRWVTATALVLYPPEL